MRALDLVSCKVEFKGQPLSFEERLKEQLLSSVTHIDLINEDARIEEAWQKWVMAGGLAAMTAGGMGAIYDYLSKKLPEPAIQQIQQAPVQTKDRLLTQALKPIEKTLIMGAAKAGLTGTELEQFMAQCAHETMNFTSLVELGTDKYIAKKYDVKYNPAKAKILGNVQPGDGVKFKGRGYLQLTGRYNYQKASQDIYGDDRLVKNPGLVERPEVAAQTSLWFWKNRVQRKVADFSNTAQATKPINPALKGLQSREEKFAKYSSQQPGKNG